MIVGILDAFTGLADVKKGAHYTQATECRKMYIPKIRSQKVWRRRCILRGQIL